MPGRTKVSHFQSSQFFVEYTYFSTSDEGSSDVPVNPVTRHVVFINWELVVPKLDVPR